SARCASSSASRSTRSRTMKPRCSVSPSAVSSDCRSTICTLFTGGLSEVLAGGGIAGSFVRAIVRAGKDKDWLYRYPTRGSRVAGGKKSQGTISSPGQKSRGRYREGAPRTGSNEERPREKRPAFERRRAT